MLDGRLALSRCPEALSEPSPGTHVGARLQKPPEVADILLERLRPEASLPGGHPLGVEIPAFLQRSGGLLGQQHEGVCALGIDLERAPGQLNPPRATRNLMYLRVVSIQSFSSQASPTAHPPILAPALLREVANLEFHPHSRGDDAWRARRPHQLIAPDLPR